MLNLKEQPLVVSDAKGKKIILDKSLKLLADSIYATLREEGCENKDIISVSSQLIGLVTTSIAESKKNQD